MAVRALLAHREVGDGGIGLASLAAELSSQELQAGRPPIDEATALALLEELTREGFCRQEGERWFA